MVVASFEVNEVLHQHSPLEARLHANLNFVARVCLVSEESDSRS